MSTLQVLERIRPIDQKLRYQIDKLIKAANTGQAIGRNDPLQFKPNPDALVSKVRQMTIKDITSEIS